MICLRTYYRDVCGSEFGRGLCDGSEVGKSQSQGVIILFLALSDRDLLAMTILRSVLLKFGWLSS